MILACSCSTAKYNGVLPEFTIDGKNYNRFIENRVPDYGINGEDGCVRVDELSLHLFRLASDSIKGMVRDAEQHDLMP